MDSNYIIMNKYIVVGGEAVLDFTYDRFEEKETLIVRLPERLTFNLHFFIQMNILIKECLNSDDVNRIIIRSPKFINYAKMTMAYIINTLTYINEQSGKKIFINNDFRMRVKSEVAAKEGKSFNKETDIEKLIKNQGLEYYVFKGKEEITRPVNHISALLAKSMPSFNQEDLKDFINTTIGEIFSNSCNHSNQDNVYFASFVQKESDNIFLYVSIIDYGRTIASNVRAFLNKKDISSAECIDWAIKPANTTRAGSGGYGLPTLISYLKATKGELYIFSGEAGYVLLESGSEMTEEIKQGSFPGTSVAFKVRLNKNNFIIKCYADDKKVDSISLNEI